MGYCVIFDEFLLDDCLLRQVLDVFGDQEAVNVDLAVAIEKAQWGVLFEILLIFKLVEQIGGNDISSWSVIDFESFENLWHFIKLVLQLNHNVDLRSNNAYASRRPRTVDAKLNLLLLFRVQAAALLGSDGLVHFADE